MSQSGDGNASTRAGPQSSESDTSHDRTFKHTRRRFRHRTSVARERDVFRQLQPWEETFKPPTLHRDPWQEPSVPVQPCPDTALSAFAQLCALRLHARRCLVSLSCKDREFVLSDMTRTTSLQYDSFEDSMDAPWLGTCSFPRSASINHKAFDEWHKARDVREIPANWDHYYKDGVSPHYLIISDLRDDLRYNEVLMAKEAPWARFYVSVPLRGGQGSVIGSITIIDDKPRHGVSAMQMKLIEEVSDTIIQHLEAVRVGIQRQRGDRLLQAIKTFNSGKDSLRGWWQAGDDAQALAMGRNVDPGTAHDRQLREDAQFGAQSSGAPRRHSESISPSGERSRDLETGDATPVPQSLRSAQTQKSDTMTSSGRRAHEKFGLEDGFDLAAACIQAYHRGANLLRESLGLDGVLFVNTAMAGKRASSDGSDRSSDSALESEVSEYGPEGGRQCEVLASSTRKQPGGGNAAAEDVHHFSLSMTSLKRLMKRYPDGSLFHIGADGNAHANSSDSQSASDSRKESAAHDRPNRDGQIVQRSLKHARSIAFYPIWDDSMDRHRACVFAYSLQEEQYRDKSEDLAYISTFGHSLSATLAHFESVAADKAKGTFISSISHELRSPLHGVLAGCEFLQETDLTTYQHDMCDTISSASQALLDTVNHILDYSKISSHVRAERQGSRVEDIGRNSRNTDDAGSVSYLDLAQLTEDVVETTTIAHRAQRRPFASGRRDWPEESRRETATTGDVSLTLDIEHKPHWHVEIQPGSWTRIVVNLLTNALKYTKKGHISIKLQAEHSELNDDGIAIQRVFLSIEDTGVGMSEDFVRHGAWLPFKQEDSHSTGTGLGLSIVHEIAKSMDADVELSSHQDKGTKVVVGFPCKFVLQSTLTQPVPRVSQFQMLSIVPHTGDISDEEEDELPVDATVEWSVGASVRQTAMGWLKTPVVDHTYATSIERHAICAITQQDLAAWQMQKPDQFATLISDLATQEARLLVLAKAVDSTQPAEGFSQSTSTVFLQQPIGPRKLLRAIARDKDHSSDYKRSSTAKGKVARRGPPSQESPKKPLAVRGAIRGRAKIQPPAKNDITSSSSKTTKEDPSYRSSASTTEDDSNTDPEIGQTKSDAEDSNDQMALLVEDNDVNMKLLVALMKKLQLKYRCAVHGKEAYDMYRAKPRGYFLILMDISMPVMDGFTATSKIRDFEVKQRLPRTRIVALTGVTNQEAKRQAFDAGVDEYYAKPVRMKELRELVDRTQDGTRAARVST